MGPAKPPGEYQNISAEPEGAANPLIPRASAALSKVLCLIVLLTVNPGERQVSNGPR